MKRIFAFLFAAAAFCACSDDNGGDGGKDIQLAPGTPKDYTIFADETSGTPSEGISFTTTGPWRATVAETRAEVSGGSPSWVTVSPDHGDAAGDYTITIGLGVNATGKDRRATITIECGSTKITITVEQKGTTEEGEVPDEGDEPVVPAGKKLISRMENTYWYDFGSGIEEDGGEIVNYFYDEKSRLTKMVVETYSETDEPSPAFIRRRIPAASAATRTRVPVTFTAAFTYGDRSVSYEITREENGVADSRKDTGSVELDEAGRAVSGKWTSYYDEDGGTPTSATYELFYDAEGYLVKSVSSEDGEERITWTGGNPTEVWWGTIDGQDVIDKASYGTVPNKTNLDLNWFCVLKTEGWAFASGDADNIFPLIGLTGKRSAYMAETVTGYKFAGYSDGDSYEYVYQTDADGLLTKITQKRHSSYVEQPYKSFETVITYTE